MFCIVPKNSDKVIVIDDDGELSERAKTNEDELELKSKEPVRTKAKKNDPSKSN